METMSKNQSTPNVTPLKVEVVPIGSVKPDPGNARVHDARNLETIGESLRRFGQQKPIVVTEDNVIRAGSGTWAAAKALGWTEIAVVKATLKGADAVAFALADNRTAELATWDPKMVDANISAIIEDGWTGDDLKGIGFSADELAKIIAQDIDLDEEEESGESDDDGEEPEEDGEGAEPKEQSPIIAYNIIFDDMQQQTAWFGLIKWLKKKYPSQETLAARLKSFIEELDLGMGADGKA